MFTCKGSLKRFSHGGSYLQNQTVIAVDIEIFHRHLHSYNLFFTNTRSVVNNGTDNALNMVVFNISSSFNSC